MPASHRFGRHSSQFAKAEKAAADRRIAEIDQLRRALAEVRLDQPTMPTTTTNNNTNDQQEPR